MTTSPLAPLRAFRTAIGYHVRHKAITGEGKEGLSAKESLLVVNAENDQCGAQSFLRGTRLEAESTVYMGDSGLPGTAWGRVPTPGHG